MNQTAESIHELLRNLELHMPGEIHISRDEIPLFKVIFSGKAPAKSLGVYYANAAEIILHEKNQTDAGIISTAIHELAHHIHFKCMPNEPETKVESHNLVFWAIHDALLDDAEKKGLYLPQYRSANEGEFSSQFRDAKNKLTMAMRRMTVMYREISSDLAAACAVCHDSGIDFEEFCERELRIPRTECRMIQRFAHVNHDFPDIPHYAAVLLSRMAKDEFRSAAASLFGKGNTIKQVRFALNEKAQKECKMSRLDYLKHKYSEKERRKEQINIQLSLFGEAITRESAESEVQVASA